MTVNVKPARLAALASHRQERTPTETEEIIRRPDVTQRQSMNSGPEFAELRLGVLAVFCSATRHR